MIASGPVELTLRPATIDDAEAVADVATALFPDDPVDPLILRHRWLPHDPHDVLDRFAVLARERVVGQCRHSHDDWARVATRYARLDVSLHPDVRDEASLNWAFDRLEEHAGRDEAEIFSTWARDDDLLALDVLGRRGYSVDRHQRHWELDLAGKRARLAEMAAEARARMSTQWVRLLTLAEDEDPAKSTQLYELDVEGEQDVPTTVPYVPQTFQAFMKWFEDPSLHLDRFWIARDGERIIGLSVLSYPPVRGHVSTEWTTTRRADRGRGIARALKLETVMQAIELGIQRVRTDNDSENPPILHLNEQMGYRRITGSTSLLKPAPP